MMGNIVSNSRSLAKQDNGVRRHKTDVDALIAFEQPNNYYRWQIVPQVSDVVDEHPQPSSSSFSNIGAPITVYNNWPEALSNASIFPYLLPSTHASNFHAFVRNWYQSACAIVYYPDSGDPKVVGSGSLIKDRIVSTARHNIEQIPRDKLFVRFFKYTVEETNDNNFLLIREAYLDIPIIAKTPALEGIDAILLDIPLLENTNIFRQYAKVLPIEMNLFNGDILPDGHYAMFHFSAGKPQISIGNIKTYSQGSRLYNEISIQAGPGASGATIIWKGLESITGRGLSIYRVIENGSVERRIINFSQFKNPGYTDNISAPYLNGSFSIPLAALNEDGYEFLRYRLDTHPGQRVPKPHDDEYSIEPYDNHSVHHIIPIADLLFLWDYFHTLDEASRIEIRRIANEFASNYRNDKIAKLDNESRTRKTEIPKIKVKSKEIYNRKYEELHNKFLSERYACFITILIQLCPKKAQRPDRTWFAWSFWNLFKGWKKDYRTDDPADGCRLDLSEKVRPQNFNPRIWTHLKDPESGLFRKIQLLKRNPELNNQNKANLYSCLNALHDEWNRRREKSIHPYNSAEWQHMGSKDGHKIYRVRP